MHTHVNIPPAALGSTGPGADQGPRAVEGSRDDWDGTFVEGRLATLFPALRAVSGWKPRTDDQRGFCAETGSVTAQFEARFNEAAAVRVLPCGPPESPEPSTIAGTVTPTGQIVCVLEEPQPSLELHSGDRVLCRMILLCGAQSGVVFEYADAVIALDRLAPDLRAQLLAGAIPIGYVLERLETVREIAPPWATAAVELPALISDFDENWLVPARTSRYVAQGQPIMVVREVFISLADELLLDDPRFASRGDYLPLRLGDHALVASPSGVPLWAPGNWERETALGAFAATRPALRSVRARRRGQRRKRKGRAAAPAPGLAPASALAQVAPQPPWRGVFAVCGIITIAFSTLFAPQPVLPLLGLDYRVSPATAGLTLTLPLLALAGAGWFYGPLSDRIGRQPVLLLATVLAVLPAVGAALAPTFVVLIVCRAIMGLCVPGVIVVGMAYLQEVCAGRWLGYAMGLYTSATVVGGVLGRLQVGLIASRWGWSWGALSLAATLLLATVLAVDRGTHPIAKHHGTQPTSRQCREGRGGEAAYAAGIAGVAADAYAGQPEPTAAPGLAPAPTPVLLTTEDAGETRSRAPAPAPATRTAHGHMNPLTHMPPIPTAPADPARVVHLYDLRLVGIGLAGSTLFCAFAGVTSMLAYHVQAAPIRLGESTTSLLYLTNFVGFGIAPFMGHLSGRIGRRVVVQGGIATMVVGLALLLVPQILPAICGLVVCNAGFFASQAAAPAYVGDLAAVHTKADAGTGGAARRGAGGRRGAMAATYLAFYNIGGAAGPFVAGVVFERGGWGAVLVLSLVLVLLASLCLWTLCSMRPWLRRLPSARAAHARHADAEEACAQVDTITERRPR